MLGGKTILVHVLTSGYVQALSSMNNQGVGIVNKFIVLRQKAMKGNISHLGKLSTNILPDSKTSLS